MRPTASLLLALAAEPEKAVKARKAGPMVPADQIREARRRDIRWETAIPVTDPHAPKGPEDGRERGR